MTDAPLASRRSTPRLRRLASPARLSGLAALLARTVPALAQPAPQPEAPVTQPAPQPAPPPTPASSPTPGTQPVTLAPQLVVLPPPVFGPAAPRDEPVGTARAQRSMIVLVDGTGLQRGESVEFVRTQDPDADDGTSAREPEVIATGEVVSVTPERVRVRVGLDTRVPVGTMVRRTLRRYQPYPYAPPRLAGVLHVGVTARAFLPIGAPVGVGVLGGIDALYRFAAPIAVRATIGAAGGVSSDPGGGTFVGHGIITLDTRYFEVGLGAGGMTARRDSYSMYDPRTGTYTYGPDRTLFGSFSLAQFVRVGAIDGLMAQVQTDVYVSDNRFQFGNLAARLQIPISDTWWLQARGGGGAAGFSYGEAVVRHRLWGNGDHGSFFIGGAVGGAGVATRNGTYGGPSVGADLEWRI